MSITRDDLQAAARAGRLHYSEIDNLLIFLSQRHERTHKQQDASLSAMRCFLGSLLAVSMATVCALLIAPGWTYSLPPIALVTVAALYLAFRAASRPGRRVTAVALRVLTVLLIALMPLGAMALKDTTPFGPLVGTL